MAYNASYGVVQVQKAADSTWVSLPMNRIRFETYQVTPDQMLDLDSYRAETGVLIRNVLSHTATKIEFNTTLINSTQWNAFLKIIKDGYTDSSERKLKLRYYDPETDGYKTGTFYRPDIQYTIRNVDGSIVNYNEIRVAFIEY